jgi:nucleotide-binding universal stress UspA family protein
VDGAGADALSYAKLIAGYDGSDHAVDGLALAELLADVTGAELLVAAVVPHEFPYAPGTAEREQVLRLQAQDMLVDAVAESDRVHTRVVVARSAAQGLHQLAESERAAALIVGSSHRGPVGRVLAGSVAERLLHGAPCPVAVAPAGFRERPDRGLRIVGCAFDGSDEARLAAQHAAYLARRARAKLLLLAVHEPELIFGIDQVPGAYNLQELAESERKRLARALEAAAAAVEPDLEVQHEVLEGSAVETLAGAAENGIDLLIVGSRAYGPVRRVLLGGVSSGLVRSSPAPVLVVPRGTD